MALFQSINDPKAYTTGGSNALPLLNIFSGYFMSADKNTSYGAPCNICAVSFPDEPVIIFDRMPVSASKIETRVSIANCTFAAAAIVNLSSVFVLHPMIKEITTTIPYKKPLPGESE
jgi:hypothetical protein